VVQAWLMRTTIHMASPGDFWRFSAGVREARRKAWAKGFRRPEREAAAAADRVASLLADGPRRRAEIVRTLGLDTPTWYGVGLWLDLIRVPPSGTWERPRADLFGLATGWLGAPPPVTEDEGIAHLVRRYLGAFGPATRADVAGWTGVPAARLAPVLDDLRLRRFCDEAGAELLDVPGAPLPDPETPAPARFIGVWDAILLAHARRTGLLPEPYRPRIFNTKTPHSFHTFLIDGRVAGTWRVEDGRIAPDPFERLPKRARQELRDEADQVVGLWSEDDEDQDRAARRAGRTTR
jgi:hypothetical protein